LRNSRNDVTISARSAIDGETIVKPATFITTSWDDGHPLDLRVAELLSKYGLRGTFYIPMIAENETMPAAQIRELSLAFEIGAHTLHHAVLTEATEQKAWQEIAGSKSWLESNTGVPCLMFCPPKGKYTNRHLEMVRKAGYLGVRNVELLSLDFPRKNRGIMLLPTTIQTYPHGSLAFAKNAVKRMALKNLLRLTTHGRSDWPALARSLLHESLRYGGVFHLWGHSWELQETEQWHRLDEALRFISEFASQAPSLTNGQICQSASSGSAHVEEMAPKVNAIRSEL
jgi:peptidoglycan/xylan/chitin deacetylase (PgdA/CDA1 family)